MRRFLAVLLVAATWFGAAGLSAPAALADQGRWKVGDSGCYWDPNDDGPDQCSPSDPTGDPQPLYSQDLVARAAQAATAIQASGADPNDVNAARTVLQAGWDASLPDEAPFSWYDPALASQLVIAVRPPRPQPPQSECVQLLDEQRQADELWLAVMDVHAGFDTLLEFARDFGRFATAAIDPLTFGVGILGVLTVTVQLYRAQLARWAGSCSA